MRARFAKDYEVIMLDVDRMTDGDALAKELRKGKSGGIPWMVILDGDGEPVITSDGPKGNVGCPAAPHEIDHFLAMLDQTRSHMTGEDRGILERELRAYGAELTGSRRGEPGRRHYTTAIGDVKGGRFADAMLEIGDAFDAGATPQAMLADPLLRPLREDPDRRLELSKLIKEHVVANQVRMVDRNEPGRRIRLTGQVVDMSTGAPLAGALMKVFHTDAGGEYRPDMDAGGGAGNPRLFGYLRTNAEGHFTIDTIMPERYTNSSVPRHVHYHVWAEGYPVLKSECFFDSDPNLSERTRKSAPERNFPIVELARDAALRMVGTLTIRVPSH